MGVACSGGCHAHLSQKTLKKKVNLTEQSQDAEKKKIAPILFLYYEQSVCPLLLNYNNVHLASSLTCQTYFRYLSPRRSRMISFCGFSKQSFPLLLAVCILYYSGFLFLIQYTAQNKHTIGSAKLGNEIFIQ